MKKALFVTLLFFTVIVSSSPERVELYIIAPQQINIYDRLIKALVYVECGDDHLKVGTHNDTGPFQITPIRLKDYNQKTINNYKLEDCFDYELSRRIFLYYAKGSYEQITRRWNGGPKGMKKESTKKYWSKVKTLIC